MADYTAKTGGESYRSHWTSRYKVLWYMHLRGDSAAAVLAFSSHPNDFPTPARGFRSDSEYAVGVSLLTWCGRNLRVMAACFSELRYFHEVEAAHFHCGNNHVE